MKIVYVTGRFTFAAGETFLIPELRELIKQGHQVLISGPSSIPMPKHSSDARGKLPCVLCRFARGIDRVRAAFSNRRQDDSTIGHRAEFQDAELAAQIVELRAADQANA